MGDQAHVTSGRCTAVCRHTAEFRIELADPFLRALPLSFLTLWQNPARRWHSSRQVRDSSNRPTFGPMMPTLEPGRVA